MLTPEAELLGAKEVVGSNLKFQQKYKKKLEKQLENGEITSDEMAIKMAKNAKSQKPEGIVDRKNSTQSLSLLSNDRCCKKKFQIENLALLMSVFEGKRCVIDFGSGSGAKYLLFFLLLFPQNEKNVLVLLS